ncbi:ANK [Mytilus coruscus]|uniref:ANK n=1 Tax=Mytilus coruscus TaxID=42192 RepID=A0A6J8E575_MYTCO|nr:ANK [Mytilus coruscus]
MGHTGNTDIVKELLNYGAKVNVQTLDRRTALHFATWRGNTDIVQQLVSHGANVNLQDEDLWAPLYWAAKLNYIQIARILVENGANLNCVNAGVFQCMIDNKDIKTEDRISLCDIFIDAGYPIHSNSSLPQILSRKPNMDQNFVKHVQTRQLDVLTLKSMCRICVRHELIQKTNGCSIRGKLSQLPLPKLLQNYIIL